MRRKGELRAETLFEDPDLTLEAVDPYLECGQLGLEVQFRQPLLDPFEPLLNPVEPILDSLQAGYQHVVLGLEPIEALVDGVEVPVDVVEAGFEPLEPANDTLDVRQDDLAVEPRQDRQEIFGHVSYPTPAPAPSGPQYGSGA